MLLFEFIDSLILNIPSFKENKFDSLFLSSSNK